jgi:hypothetical protein
MQLWIEVALAFWVLIVDIWSIWSWNLRLVFFSKRNCTILLKSTYSTIVSWLIWVIIRSRYSRSVPLIRGLMWLYFMCSYWDMWRIMLVCMRSIRIVLGRISAGSCKSRIIGRCICIIDWYCRLIGVRVLALVSLMFMRCTTAHVIS